GSSFVRAMVTMSSSSLESSLDETSVTHSCFSTKKLLLVCPFFFGKSLVFLSWLFFFPSFLFLFFFSSSSSSLESWRCLPLLSFFLLSGLGQSGEMWPFFSTIIASFVPDISPWPEHSSFGVKVETLLVDLVIQA